MDILTRFGLEKGRLTILAMIGLMIMGVVTYIELPKRENPAITIRTAIVAASFEGMSPERVEDLLAIPIERKAREIGEVEDISTLITTGSVVVNLDLYEDVPNADLQTVFQDIRNKMEEVRLPDGTSGPHVNTNYGDVSIATIAVTGEGFDLREMWDAADALRKNLYTLDGITKVGLSGVQDERVFLEIDSRKLAAVGVQLKQVIADLQAQNVILPAGELDAGGTTLALEANGDFNSVEEIGEILTQVSSTGELVRLKDLLTVRRGYVDPPQEPVYFNGKPALLLAVEMNDTRDIQKIGRALKARVAAFEQTQPIGISYHFSTYQETNVTVAINNALSNVAQTFGVVLLVLLVFLGFRPALVVALIVPFTMGFALLGMSYLGIALQQISIAAVIISLGLLVDNGLVVVEDIQNRLRAGATAKDAALDTGRQFFIPLAVASITTVSAFIPMLILDGATGEFAYSMGAVVALMLLGSWVTALYILPFIAARLLKSDKMPAENAVVQWYGWLVRRSLRWGLLIVPAIYLIVILGGSVMGLNRSEMFPLSARSDFLMYMDMPRGTSIKATRDEALAVEAWLSDRDANPEITDTTIFVGSGGPRFYLALSPADSDPASAFFVVNTNDADGAVTASEKVRAYVLRNHPGARFRVTRLSMGAGESGIVQIKITGQDGDKLLTASKTLEAAFNTVPDQIFVKTNWGNKLVKMVVEVQQDKAREFGVTSRDISDVMETFLSGTVESTYREGSDSIPIVLRADENFRDSLEDLANLSIPTSGRLISLDQVARFAPRFEFSQIRRENQIRQIIIEGKSGVLSAAGLLAHLQPSIDDVTTTLGSDYTVEIAGELTDSAKANESLASGLVYTVIVMLTALMFQFNSSRRVALTFLTIPLVASGAGIGLFLVGMPMSFFGTLGMISLAGIIINNAIVLIDQIDIERATQSVEDAIVTAAKKRVTPILLTTFTTVFGLVPMAIAGGALFEPMATLMIGGLAFATPLTLFLVPALYRLFFRD
ncbi:MAG: efflux RND transporter permease subunit [Sulfitobacter sp.]